jgi:hypothetical protein
MLQNPNQTEEVIIMLFVKKPNHKYVKRFLWTSQKMQQIFLVLAWLSSSIKSALLCEIKKKEKH